MYPFCKLLLLLLLPFVPVFTMAQHVTVTWTTGDNAPNIRSAIATAAANNIDTILLQPGKVYVCNSSMQLTKNNQVFNGQGSTLKLPSSAPYSNSFFLTTSTTTTHTATAQTIAVTKGSATFFYLGAANLTPGEIVLLQNSKTPYWSAGPTEPYYNGWYAVVISVIGNTVTLSHPAEVSFTADLVKEYKTLKNVHYKNLVADLSGRTSGFGVELANCTNSSIKDVTVKGTLPVTPNAITIGIQAQGVNCDVVHCRSYGIRSVIPGYAFAAVGTNISFRYCNGWASRCTFSSAGRNFISTQINYLYDTADGTGGGGGPLFDWHANAWRSRMDGCYGVAGGPQTAAVQLRGNQDTAQNNTIELHTTGTQQLLGAYLFENALDGAFISGNRFLYSGTGTGQRAAVRVASDMRAPVNNLHITGCYIDGGSVILGGAIGTGFQCNRNFFDQTGKVFSSIQISGPCGTGGQISDNVFVNRMGNTLNWAISTATLAAQGWQVQRDTIYIMNPDNLFPPIRINNTENTVTGNVIYTPNNYFIVDKSGTTGVNTITPNTLINGTGTPTSWVPGSGGSTTDPWTEPPVTDPPVDGAGRVYYKIKNQ